MSKWLVTATPPTTNGDLHVGHLSGPYLAGDVFARWQRMRGDTVLFCSGGDDHQTYVVTTAQRLGTSPTELAAECNEQIRETLRRANISVDAFVTPDPVYRQEIQAFFAGLYAAGKLRRRRQTFARSEDDGRFLFEAYVQGYCPECYVATCGAICETCGHPNAGSDLIDPAPTGATGGHRITRHELEVLTLPLEEHRPQIERFYAEAGAGMRPHLMRFVGQMLERPLPEFPISYPSSWGIPVALPGFEQQVYNPWAEMYPALGFMARAAGRARGVADADPWRRSSDYRLVQFLGFDNSFYFSFAHLGLALAQGTTALPEAIVTNEFYHLDNHKFSTSRRHLIWARDLIAEHGEDSVRFYLARRGPEVQVANFTVSELRAAVQAELRQPLERVIARLGARLGARAAEPLAVTDDTHRRFARFARRMARAYTLETFSLREASEAFVHLLGYLAERPEPASRPEAEAQARLGVAYLCAYAAPLLPRLAERLWAGLGIAGPPSAEAVERLRSLPAAPAPAPDALLARA